MRVKSETIIEGAVPIEEAHEMAKNAIHQVLSTGIPPAAPGNNTPAVLVTGAGGNSNGGGTSDPPAPSLSITWPEWAWFLTLALALIAVLLWPVKTMYPDTTGTVNEAQAWKAVLAGIIVVLIAFLTLRPFFPEKKGPLSLILGEDNRPSTSKFQVVLWTAAVIFSYTAIRVVCLADGSDLSVYLVGIPTYLWIAMGLSAGTAVGAKAITAAQIAADRIPKPAALAGDQTTGLRALVTDDSQQPEITKIQLVTWTCIAVTVFLSQVFYLIWHHTAPVPLPTPQAPLTVDMPQIDQALLILSGIAQGTYLGRKLVPDFVSTLSLLSPSRAKPGDEITLTGNGFGTVRGGNVVTIDGAVIDVEIKAWTNNEIKLVVPGSQVFADASLTVPVAGKAVELGLVTNGVNSANKKPFTFLPKLALPSPVLSFPAGATRTVRLSGDFLGDAVEVGLRNAATNTDIPNLKIVINWITKGKTFSFDLPSATSLPAGAYEIVTTVGTGENRIVCTEIIPVTVA